MNDMARIVRTGGRQMVELPEGFEFDADAVHVHREGDRIVLEAATDAVDPDTGLPLATLRALIREGLESGPGEPLDMERVRRLGRERLAQG